MAKKDKTNTTSNKPKGDIDFEKELWYVANELRDTAGVVMANGAMNTGSAGEKNVREYMIQNGMVDCIVQMPDKLFPTTGIPACLFILSKNCNDRDGEHRERKNEILFIDARKLGNMVSRRLRVLENVELNFQVAA